MNTYVWYDKNQLRENASKIFEAESNLYDKGMRKIYRLIETKATMPFDRYSVDVVYWDGMNTNSCWHLRYGGIAGGNHRFTINTISIPHAIPCDP